MPWPPAAGALLKINRRSVMGRKHKNLRIRFYLACSSLIVSTLPRLLDIFRGQYLNNRHAASDGECFAGSPFTLGNFIFMVGENKILPTGVYVQGFT